MCAVAAAALLCAGTASAQDIKPRILILFDTSGSMTLDVDGVHTHGDGTADPWPGSRFCCPGVGGSRLYLAKEAMSQMLNAAGDIEFALMKFPQDYVESQGGAWEAGAYDSNQVASEVDELRYHGIGTPPNYSGAFAVQSDWLCEGFVAGNTPEIMAWMDHHEHAGSGSGQADTSTYQDPIGHYYEQELRADGYTPLGEAVQQAYGYLNGVIAGDEDADCRPYSFIVLADGDYDGSVNPVTWVGNLYSNLDVDTWVIGLAVASPTLDSMASAGGGHFDPLQSGDHAFFADSQESCRRSCTT